MNYKDQKLILNNKIYGCDSVSHCVFYSNVYSHTPLGIKFERIELKGGLKKQEK